LEDRRNVGESSCNFGDGTDHRVQSLMLMMMMMPLIYEINLAGRLRRRHGFRSEEVKCGKDCCKNSCRILTHCLFHTNFSIALLPKFRSLEVSCLLHLSSLLSFLFTELITCHCH